MKFSVYGLKVLLEGTVSQNFYLGLKAPTHRPIFRGFVTESAGESAGSSPESADSTTDSMAVGDCLY